MVVTKEMLESLSKEEEKLLGTSDYSKFYCEISYKKESGEWKFLGWGSVKNLGDVKTFKGNTYLYYKEGDDQYRYRLTDVVLKYFSEYKEPENWIDSSKFVYLKETVPCKDGEHSCYLFGYPIQVIDDLTFVLDDDWLYAELDKFESNEWENFCHTASLDEVIKHPRKGGKIEYVTKDEILSYLQTGSNKISVIFSNIGSKWNYLPFNNKRNVDIYQFKDILSGRPFCSHELNVQEFLKKLETEYEEQKKDPDAKYVSKSLDWYYTSATEVTDDYKHSTDKAIFVEVFCHGENCHYSKIRFYVPRRFARTNPYNDTVYIPYWIIKENAFKASVPYCY